VLFGAVGCGRFRKAKECSLLAKTVSNWLGAQPTPSSANADPRSLAAEARATARRYEELDRTLGALDVHSPDLVPRLTRYRKLATDSAHALDEVAGALEANQAETARKKRVEIDAISREEEALVGEINADCRR
jgi:hypothetical protein